MQRILGKLLIISLFIIYVNCYALRLYTNCFVVQRNKCCCGDNEKLCNDVKDDILNQIPGSSYYTFPGPGVQWSCEGAYRDKAVDICLNHGGTTGKYCN